MTSRSLSNSADMCRNEPNIHLAEELPNPDRWHGAELSVTILGNWQYYRAKIHKCVLILFLAKTKVVLVPGNQTCREGSGCQSLTGGVPVSFPGLCCLLIRVSDMVSFSARRYLRQIAVITPYAKFGFAYIAEAEKNSIRVNFTRRTDKMPAHPKVDLVQQAA